MDTDLKESISALKSAMAALGLEPRFGAADSSTVESLANRFGLPRRYREFLLESDPVEVETATPAESIQLHPASELLHEQQGYSLDEQGRLLDAPSKSGWRPNWFIIGHSAQLGDPYFLDTSKMDAEGDCPVFTAMSGTETWQPRLCASTFVTFLQVLGATLEVAEGFDLNDYDPDNERVFREAVGHRIREVDPAAAKAGHWT